MTSHLEDVLSCGVCLDSFDHPKRLRDCPHVFCQKCLEPLVTDDSVLNCPTCRAKNKLPRVGVEGLQTDLIVKEMVESFYCVDCSSIDRFTKECGQCRVKSCSVCICGHGSLEKCELLSSVRQLNTVSLPIMQRLLRTRDDWVTFKEKNQFQKKKVDEDLTKLIETLKEKQKALIDKFDEFDKFAAEHIAEINEVTRTDESILEMKKTITDMTAEAVIEAHGFLKKTEERISELQKTLFDLPPDELGTIYTCSLLEEMNNLGKLITSRPVLCEQEDEVFSVEDAAVRRRGTGGWPACTLATGKLQISRHNGGFYDISIIDEENSVTKWTWNNCNPTSPKLQSADWWYHIPWSLKDAENKVVDYTARIEDRGKRRLFASVMEQLEHR